MSRNIYLIQRKWFWHITPAALLTILTDKYTRQKTANSYSKN